MGHQGRCSFTLYPIFGVKIEMALAVSILFGVVMLTVGLIGGTVWLLSGDKAKEQRTNEFTKKNAY